MAFGSYLWSEIFTTELKWKAQLKYFIVNVATIVELYLEIKVNLFTTNKKDTKCLFLKWLMGAFVYDKLNQLKLFTFACYFYFRYFKSIFADDTWRMNKFN